MAEHIAVLNDEVGGLEVSVAVLQTQMASVIYWGRYVVGALGALLISQAVQHLQIRKNGNGKK